MDELLEQLKAKLVERKGVKDQISRLISQLSDLRTREDQLEAEAELLNDDLRRLLETAK